MRCDVAIIGGGVIGLSIAYNLARAGCRNVALFEQAQLGSGSSGKAAGGIRRGFATEANIRWSIKAHELFQEFETEFGVDPQFRRCGYLFLASSERTASVLRSAAERQLDLGVPVEFLTSGDLASLYPDLRNDDVLLATLTADDGYASVDTVIQALAYRADELGVGLHEGCGVRGIDIRGGRVEGVVTDDGPVAADAVVIAAGVWSAKIGQMIGVDLPVFPRRRELWLTGRLPELGPLPWTVDLDADWYLRPDPEGLLISGELSDERGFGTLIGPELDARIRSRVEGRVPAVKTAAFPRRWAGSIDTTPDMSAILDLLEIENLWAACGFSGHGFMHSLVAGRVVAEWLVGGRPVTADPRPFRLSRFDKGITEKEELHHQSSAGKADEADPRHESTRAKG